MVDIGVLGRDVGDRSPDSQLYDYRNSARTWDVVTQVVCLTVTTICIGMRMYSKLLVLKNPGWEDYTSLLAWLGLIAYAVITIEADKHGNGIHQDMVAPSDLREYAKLANSSQIVYAPLIFVTKLSLFLLYLRVFAPSRKGKTYRIIHLFIWFNVAFYLANFFLKVFQCIPRSRIWDQDAPGHCININIPILVTAAINVLSDLMMLVLPIVCVWRLQMTTKRKMGISAIFAAGVFGCFSSIMRLVVSVKDRDTKDKTYDWFSEFLWTTAEVTCGIIASSLPALPTFFRHFFTKAKTKLSDLSRTRGSTVQSHSLGKSTESYVLSRGRKNQLSHSLFTMERSSDPERESDDDRAQIFSGSGYTAETRVERSRTPVQGGYYREESSGLEREDGHGHGILKIIEVDVESGPGQAHSG